MTEHPNLARAGSAPRMPASVLSAMRAALPEVAAQTIAAVGDEVPGYRDTLDPQARATLAQAVEMALSGFLGLAAQEQDASSPLAPVLDGALLLGRGEAASGRTMDALLAAYRVGARVAWRGLAGTAAEAGLSSEDVVQFAELVFAYIDALSAASVAGHAEELGAADRTRQRNLERLGHSLLTGAAEEYLLAAAQRAAWAAPTALVAVVLPDQKVGQVLARIDPRTLQLAEDVPGLDPGAAVLLVPDPGPRFADGLARGLGGQRAVVGPSRPWLSARESFTRALRAWQLGLPDPLPAPAVRGGDPSTAQRLPAATGAAGVIYADDLLAELVISADPAALSDLRARVLSPLARVRPVQAERLTQTLRSWLLHHGRRDEVAADLFVHPQTVRYRMGQIRELFGDRLNDPRVVLELTIALGGRYG